MLVTLVDNACRSNHVLFLDDSFTLHVIYLHLSSILLSHVNHIPSLLVLSLAPFIESLTTVATPVQLTDEIATFVLISSKLLITGKLTNVLETSLPRRFRYSISHNLSEPGHALGVCCPRQKDSSQFTLVMIVVRVITH